MSYKCNHCSSTHTTVITTQFRKERYYYRRHLCFDCGKRFSTKGGEPLRKKA